MKTRLYEYLSGQWRTLLFLSCLGLFSFYMCCLLSLSVSGAERASLPPSSGFLISEGSSAEAPLEDGVYILESAVVRSYVLDVAGGSVEAGAYLQMYRSNGSKAQKFRFKYLHNGYYKITNEGSALVLDVPYGSVGEEDIWQYRWNGSEAQQWQVLASEDGSISLRPRCSSTLLGVRAAQPHNGSTVSVLEEENSRRCRFYPVPQRDNGFVVTQYGDPESAQRSFYTITGRDGGFVIIDGGFDIDAPELLTAIRDHGNHVNAWILTHPHPDHIGAFNYIMAREDTYHVEVDDIYAVDVNHDRYMETALEVDDYNVYDTFEWLEGDLKNLHLVHEGDVYDVKGLTMKVLSSWDSFTDALPGDLCNQGGMVFTLSAGRESMLFTADTGVAIEEKLLRDHGEDIRCDYVQCAHHGNHGLSHDFYLRTGAGKFWMDAPAWLRDPEDARYDAAALKAALLADGSYVFDFDTTPNSFLLH